MEAKDNTKDLIELLGGNDFPYSFPCGWGWYAKHAFEKGYHVVATGEGSGVRRTTMEERRQKLLNEDGTPKELFILDNGGETWDRYSVYFTGPYIHLTLGEHMYVGMSALPYDTQGFGQHGSGKGMLTIEDVKEYTHVGKPITFNELPPDCKRLVMDDYNELWDLVPTDG